jgi:multiple sugar transport system permease protein
MVIGLQVQKVLKNRISTGGTLKGQTRETLAAVPFVLPGLVLVLVFIIYPMFFNIRISLSDYRIVDRAMDFVGFKNYMDLFTEPQGRFWLAYRNNLLYAAVTTPFIMFFGLLSAVLINSLRRGRVFFRAGFYLPVITSWVIVGLVFLYMFNNGRRGLINYILVDVLHILGDYVPWIHKEWTGNLAIWTLGVWKNIGWAMIVYLAALQGIPKDLYEAASIEGAGFAARLFRITIPAIRPTTFFILVNMLIGAFNVFLQVFVMTKGNPNGRTSVLQYLLYDRSFNLFEFGQGAAIGLIAGLTVFLLTIVLNRVLKRE